MNTHAEDASTAPLSSDHAPARHGMTRHVRELVRAIVLHRSTKEAILDDTCNTRARGQSAVRDGLRPWFPCFALLLCGVPRNDWAQTGVIGGTVVDSTGRGLTAAGVSLTPVRRSTTTNYLGEFRFAGLDSGRYEITIRRIGYALFRDTISLTSGEKIDRDFELQAQTVQLDSVRIAATPRELNPFLEDFEARRKLGFGHFIDGAELRKGADSRSFVNYLASHIPGLRIAPKTLTDGTHLASGRVPCSKPVFSCGQAGYCMVAVYIDGNALYTPGRGSPPDFDDYKSEDFAAVEWYAGGATIPSRFNATGSNCGVLLLWRRTK